MESVASGRLKRLVVAAIFAFCVAPTYISYQSYLFRWDDSDYLRRSIAVSRAFWSANLHGVKRAMVSWHPPAMTLLGVPWGRLPSWDTARNCFITLAALISAVAALCLYLLLRIGAKPFFLVLASVCVFASLGPYPRGSSAHADATAFLADSLLAWTTFAAVLLIPYEARIPCPSIRSAFVRSILYASILSLGVMTKVSFLYFIMLIVPALFFIGFHRAGLRSASASLIALVCWTAPSAIYLARYGRSAFAFAKAASFGQAARLFSVPLLPFLANSIRESPGLALSFVLTATALIYLVLKKRVNLLGADFLALLILMGYGLISLASPNREIRFAYPVIVALPFLAAIFMSGKGHSNPGPSAALAAGLVFGGLLAVAVPTRYRANRQSLSRCEAVLAQAVRCNAHRIVLATDSSTLNGYLMALALEFSSTGASVDTLAYQAMSGVPIEEDFRALRESDQVVFQDGDASRPTFTNQRAVEYERYVRQGGAVPIRVGDDVSVYSMRCSP